MRRRSDPGCLLFVKLRQFYPADSATVVVDTCRYRRPADGEVFVHPLHRFETEEVFLLDGGAGSAHGLAAVECPREFLMLAGEADVFGHRLNAGAWLAYPGGRRRDRALRARRPAVRQNTAGALTLRPHEFVVAVFQIVH